MSQKAPVTRTITIIENADQEQATRSESVINMVPNLSQPPLQPTGKKKFDIRMFLMISSTMCALAGVPIGILKLQQGSNHHESHHEIIPDEPELTKINSLQKSPAFKKLHLNPPPPLHDTIPLQVCLSIKRSEDEDSQHISNWLIYSNIHPQHYCELVIQNKLLTNNQPYKECCYMMVVEEDLKHNHLQAMVHQTIENTDAVFIKEVFLSYNLPENSSVTLPPTTNSKSINKQCYTEDMTLMSRNGFGRLSAYEFWLDGGDKSCGGECCRSEIPCTLICAFNTV